jgi:hypothetical protein
MPLTAAAYARREHRRARFGDVYYWSLCWLCASAVLLGSRHWARDRSVILLGALSFGSGSIGRLAHRRRWRSWISTHVGGMGISYIAMLTALFAEDGENLPLLRKSPLILLRILPSLLGMPLVARALWRRRHLQHAHKQCPKRG